MNESWLVVLALSLFLLGLLWLWRLRPDQSEATVRANLDKARA